MEPTTQGDDARKEEHSLVKTLSMPDHGGEDKGENIGQHKVQDQQNQNVKQGYCQNLKGIRDLGIRQCSCSDRQIF